jgi:hypothetical protein
MDPSRRTKYNEAIQHVQPSWRPTSIRPRPPPYRPLPTAPATGLFDGQAHGTFTAARGRPSASTAKASRVAGTLRNAAFQAKVAGPLTSVPKGRSLSALHHHYCASRDSAPTQPARHPNRPVDRCPVLGNAEAGVAISRRSNGNGGHRSSGHRSPTVCPDIFGERCPGPRRPARDWGSDCLPRCERSWGQGPVELRTCR